MQKISDDIKTAMKARDKETTGVLRMILSEFKYAQTSVDRDAVLDDTTAMKVLLTYHKRLEKSLADYPEGEQREKILSEIKIVEEYLPKRATEAEIEQAVEMILQQTEDRNFGVLMKQLIAKFGASADGKVLSKVLKSKLG